ncbi:MULTISPECIES: hypothetical protein [unclassified Sphingomonas]|uniref:hypothetical protein n=1 Tax=unclassified Sphingomonas TaxID=196159 RepID=UPI0006FFDFB6|nr:MULTISPECIES: hypothetical protein [unclassified Sphingomonas]KQX26104.1 hypothetical protein ASD17_01170 [Sphingomonas sp. Root1294]KQY69171.1 hypothetical protein ASD39_02365 [Sphingomonas sp. Root50]KRB89426.1 hypothetical protein ASE22_17280 [Sphingomonas sp. Root720]
MSLPGFGRVEREAGVRNAISRAAQRVGVDFSYLFNQARSESGLNPNARAQSSSAGGLFQFIDQSWLGAVKMYGAKHGLGWAADAISRRGDGGWKVDGAVREQVMALKNDPEASSLMAAEFASDNADGLQSALGRQPRSADLYFAHFLGLEGATRFLKAADARPDASAAALFPREARANRSIFYDNGGGARSLSQVYALMAKKIDDDGAPSNAVPARDGGAFGGQDLRLAYAKEVFEGDGKAMPDTTEMLAMMGGNRGLNLLKPNPANARLAYMMLASDGDGSITDGTLDA